MYVIHMGKEPISDKQNDIPPIVIPPKMPFEIKDEFTAKMALKHLRLKGLVEVPAKAGQDGFPVYDVEEAKKLAYDALRKAQEELLNRYIRTQQEDRISVNKPPMPPSRPVREIIEDLNVDLSAMGINLAGAGFSIPTKGGSAEEVQQLRSDFEELQRNMLQLMKTHNELLKQVQKGDKAKAG